ncbi:MAG: discoidin domain-containing protein [Colwellia sp.]
MIKKIKIRALVTTLLMFSHSAYALSGNIALNQSATASSAIQSPLLVVDGDMTTRWESNYQEDPSSIVINLGQANNLAQITLHWEAANAANYQLQGSNNGNEWQTLSTYTGGEFGARTDNHNVSGTFQYLRMLGTARSEGNLWGYSLYEIEVFAEDEVITPPTSSIVNIAINSVASASSEISSANLATDGITDTRWESNHGEEISWLSLDLGQQTQLARAVIVWEVANAKSYKLQGSNDTISWQDLAVITDGTFGERTDDLAISGDYRYIQVSTTERSDGNQWGYSIREFEVYPAQGSQQPQQPVIDPNQNLPINTETNYTPLFNNSYTPESSQEWHIEPDGTIVTTVSGRARSRHESEDIFYTFPVRYFEHRTFGMEIHDNIAGGDTRIAIYYEPEYAHFRQPECRSAYHNVNRADFNNNGIFEPMALVQADANGKGQKWVCYITRDAHDGDDGLLDVGEWMEIEFQQFLGLYDGDPAVQGQTVYYTDTYRFKLGQPGIYIENNEALDAKLRTGGDATAPYVRAGDSVPEAQVLSSTNESVTYKVGENGKWVNADDPNGTIVTYPILDGTEIYDDFVVASGISDWTSFFREALNTRWDTHNTFMQGRRVFHTFFDSGIHAEPGNPNFIELSGLSTGLNIQTSCIGCHVNNGRGQMLVDGSDFSTMVMKVGSGEFDALGHSLPHNYLGSVIQNNSLNNAISAEANITVQYVEQPGNYNDGIGYSLRKPSYNISNIDPLAGDVLYVSPRTPQSIVGLGLLEAIPEADILQWHDPQDSNNDGISGRANRVIDPITNQTKIGRFGWKANHVSLTHFTAGALSGDIGVNTSVFSNADCGFSQTACQQNSGQGVELFDDKLQQLVVYMQALGAPSRRPDDVELASVQQGEQIFANIGCNDCHRESFESGHQHPLAEMRGNTVKAYTDLLLHNMGDELSDTLTKSAALNREWRTPPLWGLGLQKAVNGHSNLLHDGRARNIEEAILWHGGEATNSQQAFKTLNQNQRNDLLSFLNSL